MQFLPGFSESSTEMYVFAVATLTSRQRHRPRPGFFLPVRVLSRVFRGKYLERLRQPARRREAGFARTAGSLDGCSGLRRLADAALCHKDWVVYAKRPFGGPAQVLKYLARYTHRVAISNARLLKLHDGQGHVSLQGLR